MLVWLGRHTVQNMVIGSGQYTLLSGRPVQTGQVLFEFKFTTAQSAYSIGSWYIFFLVFYFKLNHHTLLFCILCLKINTINVYCSKVLGGKSADISQNVLFDELFQNIKKVTLYGSYLLELLNYVIINNLTTLSIHYQCCKWLRKICITI